MTALASALSLGDAPFTSDVEDTSESGVVAWPSSFGHRDARATVTSAPKSDIGEDSSDGASGAVPQPGFGQGGVVAAVPARVEASMAAASGIAGVLIATGVAALADGSTGHALAWLGLAIAALGNAAADWILLREGQ